MASIYENTGISVKLGRRDGDWAITLKDAVETYRHEISSEHGFERATVTFNIHRGDVSGWLNRGLGMDIDVRGPSGIQIWNGFVNSVDVNDGARKVSVGRMSEIANRVSVIYGVIIEGADEPIIGEQTITDYADNTESQDQYGVWEKVISGGSRTDTEAAQIRDTVLAKYAWPTTSYTVSAASEGAIGKLQCVGYHKFLDAFTYNTTVNDEVLASTKVEDVLAAEASVNGVISTDYTRVEPGSAYVGSFEDKNRTALTIIKECASFGDASNNTWSFGVYENRQAVFEVIPGNIEYRYLRGTGPIVERLSGGAIDPWMVRPSRWLFMPDMILGGAAELPIPDTREQMYRDRRVAFVERVTYTAPYGLAIHGSKVSKPSQQLARWGLGNF